MLCIDSIASFLGKSLLPLNLLSHQPLFLFNPLQTSVSSELLSSQPRVLWSFQKEPARLRCPLSTLSHDNISTTRVNRLQPMPQSSITLSCRVVTYMSEKAGAWEDLGLVNQLPIKLKQAKERRRRCHPRHFRLISCQLPAQLQNKEDILKLLDVTRVRNTEHETGSVRTMKPIHHGVPTVGGV